MKGGSGAAGRFSLVEPRPGPPSRRRLKKGVFLLFLLLLGAGLLLVKGGQAFCGISEITVTGTVRLSEEEIISQSGIKKGTNLLLLRIKKAEERLALLPGLCSATVIRRLPSTVYITVQEREPAACLLAEGRFWLLDREGILFDSQLHPAENLPIITGAADEELALTIGEPLGSAKRNDALLSFMQALQQAPPLEAAELNISDPSNLLLYTLDGRKVLLGDSGKMAEKLILLQAYLQESGIGSCLDLRTGDRLVVVAEQEGK